jgi:penicillin G amidase
MRVWRVVRWGFLLALLAILVAAAALLFRVWAPLPATRGTLALEGLSQAVEVLRDEHGVPHIRAASEADALFALGFVHAQDRLWQLELQRRLASGRLAEILGPAALPSDRLFRTVGIMRAATSAWARMSPQARALVEAYTQGVNAQVARRRSWEWPVEYALLGIAPEPYLPQDAIAWSKVVAWGLGTNWRDELLRLRVMARVGEEGAAALMPPSTDGHPVVLPEGMPADPAPPGALPEATARATARGGWPSMPAAAFELLPGASNNWVVSGARTATGAPILANDPHLLAQSPAFWYLAHVQGGRYDAIGATMPGVPLVVLGHNGRIAWGFTNVMADVQDLFIERVNARQEALYLGAWEPMRILPETIRVEGAADETLAVRITRHGPLLSDLWPETTEALALRWTGLDDDDGTLEAGLSLPLASNWEEFTVGLAGMKGPIQNIVYADTAGNIGYIAPGAYPVRLAGDGRVPVPGWTGEYEWTGYLPAEQWPRIYNPTRGYVATANNRLLPGPEADRISTNWEPGYRAARIVEMIENEPAPLTVERTARLQADVTSLEARALLPWLRRASIEAPDARAAADRLQQWTGGLHAGSADAAVFKAWRAQVATRLFADALGPAVWREYRHALGWLPKALHRLSLTPGDDWCDDRRTAEVETCEQVFGLALSEALEIGAREQATPDVAAWRWGRQNRVVFPHAPLHASTFFRRFFSVEVEHGGDEVTVNPVIGAFEQAGIASYRQVIDLADLDRSLFVVPLGQSAQVLSRHRVDLLPRWRDGDHIPMRYSREAVDAGVRHRLVLRPVN